MSNPVDEQDIKQLEAVRERMRDLRADETRIRDEIKAAEKEALALEKKLADSSATMGPRERLALTFDRENRFQIIRKHVLSLWPKLRLYNGRKRIAVRVLHKQPCLPPYETAVWKCGIDPETGDIYRSKDKVFANVFDYTPGESYEKKPGQPPSKRRPGRNNAKLE